MSPSTSAATPSTRRAVWRWRRLLWAVLLPLLLLLDRPLIRGDGVAYLAWADSLIVDGDIQFDNQLQRLGPVNTYQLTWNETTQRWVNIFPFGAALVQAPFYALGHWFALHGWWDANPDYFHQMQGLWRPYSLWLMIGANALALMTVALAWGIGRRLTGAGEAALAALALFIGTPLIYYSTISPLNSHGPGAWLTTLFVVLLVRCTTAFGVTRPPAWWQWAALGVCAGGMVLVRWQLGLVVACAWLCLLWPQRWRGPLLATGTAMLTIAPLLVVWRIMFGAWLVVPYQAVTDQPFLRFPNHMLDVLRLLLIHSPVLLAAVAGLPRLWRRHRRWGAFVLSAFVVQLFLNGSVLDWWAGETYGMRRMSELYPLYVLSACAALGTLRQGAARAWLRAAVRGMLWVSLPYSLLYLAVFINYTWTNPAHLFIDDPWRMLAHVWQQAQPWQTTLAVWRAHLGPLAWRMPGP